MPSLRCAMEAPPRPDPYSDDDDDEPAPQLRIFHNYDARRRACADGAGPSHAYVPPPETPFSSESEGEDEELRTTLAAPISAMRKRKFSSDGEEMNQQPAKQIRDYLSDSSDEEELSMSPIAAKRKRSDSTDQEDLPPTKSSREEMLSSSDDDVPLGELCRTENSPLHRYSANSEVDQAEFQPIHSDSIEGKVVDEEYVDERESSSDNEGSTLSSICSHISERSCDGYPYHDYLYEYKTEPDSDVDDPRPHPKASDVLGINIEPGLSYSEKEKMYHKLIRIRGMGPVYPQNLTKLQRHTRTVEHQLLVDDLLDELNFKAPFRETDANRRKCREYKAIVEKIYQKERATSAPIPDLSLKPDSDDEENPTSSTSQSIPSSSTAANSDSRPNNLLPPRSSTIVVPGPPVPVMLPNGFAPRFEETRLQYAPETAPKTVTRTIYECTICTRQFNSLTQLNLHLRKHPKKCNNCGLKFKRFDDVQKHAPYCMRANGLIVIPRRK